MNGANDWAEPDGDKINSRILYSAQPNPTEADVDVELIDIDVPGAGTDDPVFAIARFADANNYYSAGSYRAAAGADKKSLRRSAARSLR